MKVIKFIFFWAFFGFMLFSTAHFIYFLVTDLPVAECVDNDLGDFDNDEYDEKTWGF